MDLDKANNKLEIVKLVDKLNYYTKLYDEGKPEISDQEWDDLYFKLIKLENKTGIYLENSPTQRVNYQVVNKLEKVEHDHLMLSLDKTKSIDDIKSFIGSKDYIVMAKMDGLTCSLTYENGKLVKAETRGNGIIGENILHNALQVKNIPNKIEYQNKIVIDGEIICDYETFKNFDSEYKNPRNFASGSIRLLDSKESAMRSLSFIAWDCIEGIYEDYLHNKLIELSGLGFTIVPFACSGEIELNAEVIENVSKERNYPIDGLVFKYDKISDYDNAGKTDHHFKGGMAYKFYDDEYETILKDIEWSMGRTGVLTPVAIFDSINIDGTEVSRANLHNISVLKETLHGYGWEGQKVKVFKSNMIIPQISEAESDNEFTKIYFHYPMICPICGGATEIIKENDSEMLYCSNASCEGKLLNKLDHFCGKKGLDIKGLSKATLEKLMNWNWINDLADIFDLKEFRSEWVKKAGFGVASVDKILNSIEESKNTTLDKVIAAASIPEIGSRVSKDLIQIYKTWTDFRAETNFTKINGIGYEMNKNLLNFDYSTIDYIVNNYLNIQEVNKENSNNNLEGKVFCITGKLKLFKNRTELTMDIENKGGKVVSAMSSRVDYLINNDNTSQSAKNIAAKKAGIPIITEEEYKEM